MTDPEFAEVLATLPPSSLHDHLAERERVRATGVERGAVTDPAVDVADSKIDGPPGGPPLPVRLYRPATGPVAGCAVFLHGGAFVLGDVDLEHRKCLRLAARAGVVVVSVDYRLAPEAPFPAGLDDATRALEWVREHATGLGTAPGRVGYVGSSAGACIAAAAALRARDRGGPRPAFLVLVYPVLDDRLATPSMHEFAATRGWNARASADMWRLYLGHLGGGDPGPYAAPARAGDLARLPPTHVVTAGLDPLRDEGRDFARRLAEAGVPTLLTEVPGVPHGFDLMLPDAATSRSALDGQVRFLVGVLGAGRDLETHER